MQDDYGKLIKYYFKNLTQSHILIAFKLILVKKGVI